MNGEHKLPSDVFAWHNPKLSKISEYLKEKGCVGENERIVELELEIEVEEPVVVKNVVTNYE